MSRKFALVIGNTEYIDPGLVQLTAPRNDAEDFARVLRDQGLCAFDEVRVAINEISSAVTETIDEFFDQKKPDDLLVLYFSGHGVRDEFGALYLAFKNTIRTRLRGTAIKSDYIREAMDQSRSKRQVVILDCCNSGAFPQGTKAEIGGPMGMISALQGYGRFVLMASDATQFAWEGDKFIGEIQDSLFTHFLVKGLEGEADMDADGKITVDELYDYAYEQISRVTAKQTPTKAATKVEGEFVLRRITRLEDIKPVALPHDLLDEVEDTRPYVREVAVQKLEKILKGRNLGMTRSAIEALEKIVADQNTTRRTFQAATDALEAYRQEQKAGQEREVDEETGSPVTEAAPESRPASAEIGAATPSIPARKPVEAPLPRASLAPQPKPEQHIKSDRPGGKNRLVWVGAVVGLLAIVGVALWSVLSRSPSIPTPAPTDVVAANTATPAPANTAAVAPAILESPTIVASLASSTPDMGIGAPTIGSKDVSTAAWNAGVPTLRDKAVEKYTASDNAQPVTLPYTVKLAQSDQVLWEWYWCSESQSILDDNLQNIKLKFVLDGEDVTSQVINAGFTNGGWYCRIFFVALQSWVRGSYHLTTTATIGRTISDGTSDYIAGDYIDDYTVNVP